MSRNTDPFAPWNNPMYENDPFAAHNGYDSDNPFKSWNNPFGSTSDLSDSEKRSYHIEPDYDDEY